MECPIHAGKGTAGRREPYDPIMQELHDNQSGEGRHKCTYCAYERGRSDYRNQVAEWLDVPVDELPE